MGIKKQHILYIFFVLVILSLGAYAYNEVAVKNRPLSPDEISELKDEPAKAEVKNPDQEVKQFESTDKSLRFSYPSQWVLENESVPVGNDITQSFIITNYARNTDVSGGFPEDGVSIEVKIYNLTEEVKSKWAVDCSMKVEICSVKEINGQRYKYATGKLNTGFIHTQLSADKSGKRVMLNALVGIGNKQDENRQMVEKLFDSLQVR